MKYILAVAVMGVVACEPSAGVRQNEISPRQQPSVTTPGVHVSGHANIGVTRRF
ncbi:hypothetical protein OS189_12950 [Sulfitobacter sp. F26169L]|uniref:hypothetical protein n=1 Tax=Sulfitobacter sp. F26169L TaxID=2996015 RepID=UPI002260C9B1|nr:hypothetical protein [Sulfitobacter sp. F26169L]MCX7567253.1 hypothetical protein [Sulfitobacter sp. F26169L]